MYEELNENHDFENSENTDKSKYSSYFDKYIFNYPQEVNPTCVSHVAVHISPVTYKLIPESIS